MLEIEILVAPFLVALVRVRAESIAGGTCVLVPCNDVFVKRVIRRQIVPATEPPDRLSLACREETEVGVRRGHVGIQGVDDERHADRLEALACELGPGLRGRRRHFAAENVGETDAGFFEDASFGHDPGLAAATAGPFPYITFKSLFAVEQLEFRADPVLQCEEILSYLVDIAHDFPGRSTLPLRSSRISEGPEAGPQVPGHT